MTGSHGVAGRARWVAVHAVLVGAGWIPLVFAVWVTPGVEPRGEGLAAGLVGGVTLVAGAFAVPLGWPVLIAVAWFEGGLAERMAAGDRSAARTAACVLRAFALAFATLAAAAAALAWSTRAWLPRPAALTTWSWLPAAALAAAHLALADTLHHTRPRVSRRRRAVRP